MFDLILFGASAFLTVAGAVMVTIERNLIHACIYLLASLIGVAGLYLTLGADLIAAVQLVVYVGGVVILILFAVMLTGGGVFNKTDKLTSSLDFVHPMGNGKTYFWGILTSSVFLLMTISFLDKHFIGKDISGGLGKMSSTVDEIGTKLITDHVLVFELSSVLLLGALIGAAIIARPDRSKDMEQ